MLHLDEHQLIGTGVLDTVHVAEPDGRVSTRRPGNVSVPRVTRALPPTTTQCSARNAWRCKDRRAPGFTTMRFTA